MLSDPCSSSASRRIFSLVAGCVALVCAAGLVACGGSGSGGSAQRPSGSPIVIGTVGGFTSTANASSQGGVPKALQAWAADVNASGGLNGHPVKVIVKDLGDNLTGGLAAVRQLVEQDHVIAIVGESDDGDSTWAKYVQSKNVPVVGGLPISISALTNPDFYPIGANLFALEYAEEALALTRGPRFGSLFCAESPQCAFATPIHAAMSKVSGLKVPVNAKVAASTPDYTSVCEQLKSANVESFTFAGASAVALKLAQQCKADGVKASLIEIDGTIGAAWANDPNVEGMLGGEAVIPWFVSSIPAAQKFHEVMDKYAGDLGGLMGTNVAYTYDSGVLFAKAVSLIPSGQPITAANIVTALHGIKNETLGGLTPPLTFTAGQPTRVDCYFTEGIKNGKFYLPNGTKTACAPDAVIVGILSHLG